MTYESYEKEKNRSIKSECLNSSLTLLQTSNLFKPQSFKSNQEKSTAWAPSLKKRKPPQKKGTTY